MTERLADIKRWVECPDARWSAESWRQVSAELLAEVERLIELLRHVVALAADGEHPQPNSKCQWCQQIMAEGRQG